ERQQTAQRQGTALDRAIVEADYKALGGVVRSLTQRADQEYAQLVSQDSAYAETVQHVMLRLLAIGGGDVTRRRVPLAELTYPGDENARAQKVIQQFSAVRLLVKGQDLSGQPYVEPAHDALVRGWQRLLAWQQKEENLGLQRRLTHAALDWQRAQKPRFLWHADPRLEILSQVLKSPRSWLNQLETEFVQHSLARKKRNGRLWISGTLGIVLLLSAGLVAALLGQRQSKVAQIDTYRQSARLSLSQNHSLDGLLPSLAAGELFQHPLLRWFPPDPALRDRVQGTLQWATYNVKEQNRLQGHTGPVRSQWSPQGDRIVSAGEDGDIRVWAADGKELA
ncbi:MAG: WD40 repeat domain-containing protein, partial [Pseudomonadota bacterium]